MAVPPLTTDRQLASLRPQARPYERRVSGARGFGIRVFPSGAKHFELRYALKGGPRRRQPLGEYPEVSLVEARRAATVLRAEILKGVDPVAEREAALPPAGQQDTLDQLAEAYWAAADMGLHGGRRRPKRAITISNERHLWKRHIQADLGGTAVVELKRSAVKTFMRALVSEKGLSAASVASIGGLLHSVMAYALQEEMVEANPVTGLARPLALTSRDRVLDDPSLRLVWDLVLEAAAPGRRKTTNVALDARPEPVIALAIQLLMLTLTRRSEVAGALKSEFDLDAGLWVIPAERAKANHKHVVPLTPAALDVISEAFALDPKSRFAFPSPRIPDQAIDAHAITRTFSRIFERRELPLRSPHDVRRTGATVLTGQYGITRFIVGLVLGHTPNDGAAVTSVYDRHTYVPEKRDALLKWAEHLTGTAGADAGGPTSPAPGAPAGDGEELSAAQSEALRLCAEGRLHQAVLVMCMAATRHGGLSPVHLTLLSEAGTRFASEGDLSSLEAWIAGFDG